MTCVRDFFPLHHDRELATLSKSWARIGLIKEHVRAACVGCKRCAPRLAWRELKKLVYQPLHLIRNYYGERIALYYAFVGVYTECLIWPMILGVACQIEYWFGDGTFNFGGIEGNVTGILYSILMSLWSVYFLEKWKGMQHELQFIWGTEHFEARTEQLYAFRSVRSSSPGFVVSTLPLAPSFPHAVSSSLTRLCCLLHQDQQGQPVGVQPGLAADGAGLRTDVEAGRQVHPVDPGDARLHRADRRRGRLCDLDQDPGGVRHSTDLTT